MVGKHDFYAFSSSGRTVEDTVRTVKECCAVKKDDIIQIGEKDFYLTHKPVNHKSGCENLVGHLHKSRGQWFSFGINVSCDLNYFRPLSENDIMYILNERNIYYFSDENFKIV